jgi:Rad3-related DNA helicase
MSDWREFFPFPKPRKDQENVLDQLVEAVNEGKRYLILALPTGVGKSAIAVTMSRWIAANLPTLGDEEESGGVIVTSQKTLQDQYTNDFSSVAADLRSSANYPCLWSEELSCAETARITLATGAWPCKTERKCEKSRTCPYKVAKSKFIASNVGITNYSYLLSESTYAKILKPRQLLVLDECHSIETQLRKFATALADESIVKDLKLKMPAETATEEEVIDWMKNAYKPALEKTIDSCVSQVMSLKGKYKKIPPNMKSLIRLHEQMDKRLCQVIRWCTDRADMRTEYVMVRSDPGAKERTIEFKPLDVGPCAGDVLYSRGRFVLLMSATILDFNAFVNACGIPKDKSKCIELPSPFNPKSFGIVYKPIVKMSKGTIDQATPHMVKQIESILDSHPNEKGVIHTATYSITSAIGAINNPRLLVQISGKDRDVILKEHLESSRPTVLVSPSMMEGLDLYDDLGRFQVICKIPYPFLGDPVVRRLLERSQRWYDWHTALSVVQSIGRCVRNEDDWAKTYILDECFGELFLKCTDLFPSTFSAMEVDESGRIDLGKKKFGGVPPWKRRKF